MGGNFLKLYNDQIRQNLISADVAQSEMASALAALETRLSTYQPPQNGLLGSFFGPKKTISTAPKGLYLFGGVGRGKTMLMDMFYEMIDLDQVKFDAKNKGSKARFHFNEFMALSHERIAKYRHSHEGDPIPLVATEFSQEAKLICFDEFYVTDIADAMILGRLFTALFKQGVVIIATSNCPISELYKDGLNRQLFEPFIDLLQQRMHTHEVTSQTDYRLRDLTGKDLYFSPLSQATDEAICHLWQAITGKAEGKPAHIIVKGRTLIVPEASSGAARFSFDDLCKTALGRDDYLALAARYHTIFIEDIPEMKKSHRNEARRFITLIDTLYDQGIRLVATAEAEPENLYKAGDNAALFERTSSRLIEMRRTAHIEDQRAST